LAERDTRPGRGLADVVHVLGQSVLRKGGARGREIARSHLHERAQLFVERRELALEQRLGRAPDRALHKCVQRSICDRRWRCTARAGRKQLVAPQVPGRNAVDLCDRPAA
jgi:hypothetical protein